MTSGGYVGLSIATLLSQRHHVTAVDIVPEKVDLINHRKSPIQDDYIEKYFAEKDLDLTATLDAEMAYKEADFVVIATPTNYDSRENFFDTSAVETVIRLVMKVNPEAIMVIKSTIPVTLVGLAFGVVLFAMTYVQDSIRSYEVSGSFAISTRNHSDGVYINGSQVADNNDFHLAEDMVDAVVYVLRSNLVLEQVIQQQGLLGTTVDELKSNLTVSQYQATQILEMHFIWRTAEEAESIWQAIIDVANQNIPTALQLGQLTIINAPEVSQLSLADSGKILPVLLTMLGFCCGIGIALMELILRPTLTNPRDAETMFGLETIGIIPQDELFFRSRQGSMLTATGPDRSNVLQNYSAAAYILRNRLGTKEQHHCCWRIL